jgi:hypothetical protein
LLNKYVQGISSAGQLGTPYNSPFKLFADYFQAQE